MLISDYGYILFIYIDKQNSLKIINEFIINFHSSNVDDFKNSFKDNSNELLKLLNIDIEKQFLSKNKFKEFKFIKNYSENDLFIFHFLIFIFNNGYSFFTIMQNKVSFIIKINHIENIKYEINKVKIEKISNVFKYDYTHNKINIIQDNIKK